MSNMIEIPGGTYRLGTDESSVDELASAYGYHPSWFEGETPIREVTLEAYEIDEYPVTEREYGEFCDATDHNGPPHWEGDGPPEDQLDHPVVYVNQSDAEAFASWRGKRLPTEDEWEAAARGTAAPRFPWGSEFEPGACCFGRYEPSERIRTMPVTAHPDGASEFGVRDLIGNVAEWCQDGPGPNTAYIKGGAWLTDEEFNLRPAARSMSGVTSNASVFYGFRCVGDV